MLNIEINHNTNDPIVVSDQQIETIIHDSLRILGIEKDLTIEIEFVDEKEIGDLNVKHRNIDSPTDVLSFPQSQIESSPHNILGTIVICPKWVIKKEEEMPDVIKHGLLHLLGFDHEQDENAWDVMARKINCQL